MKHFQDLQRTWSKGTWVPTFHHLPSLRTAHKASDWLKESSSGGACALLDCCDIAPHELQNPGVAHSRWLCTPGRCHRVRCSIGRLATWWNVIFSKQSMPFWTSRSVYIWMFKKYSIILPLKKATTTAKIRRRSAKTCLLRPWQAETLVLLLVTRLFLAM